MRKTQDAVSTSKFLTYVLRHAPESIGVTLDRNGWVAISELLAEVRAAGWALDRATLDHIVATSDKQRFTISPDGNRIRAAQGHSVEVDLGIEPMIPPPVLFHGTAVDHVAIILTEGLRPGKRQHVHLSIDAQTAVKVAHRHGRPAMFRVDASSMHESGLLFWRADNGVWLTDRVPPEFLRGPATG